MWSPWKLYRHRQNQDIAFRVVTRFYIRQKDMWSLKVEWWNIGACHAPHPMTITQRLTLHSDARKDWVEMELHEKAPPLKHVMWHAS